MSPWTSELPTAPVARSRGVRRVLVDSGYALSAFVVAVPAFVLAVILVSLGLGLAVLVGGVLVLSLAAYVARGFAALERHRLRTMQGRRATTPEYTAAAPGSGFWRRALTPLGDPQSWLDVLWSLVGLVTGTVAFAVTLTWWAMVAGGLTYWFWQRWIPFGDDDHGLAYLLGLGDGRAAESGVNLVIGLLALVTLPLVVRLVALCHASLASVLLSSRAELQSEVRRVTSGRDAARLAEAESLRRLERDIHDGPQQRLVRLALDLGRARRALDQEPTGGTAGEAAGEAAGGAAGARARLGEALDSALLQARETVEELRSLSRGIAPPILVDRGLEAALAEVCARCEVPVAATVDVPADLAPHLETAVYFVVAEALTNVAKHSGAHGVRVLVTTAQGRLVVEVEDDGSGGAHVAKGQGLAGLEQRVRAADGTLRISSPVGGPTLVRAEMACG